MRKVNKKISVLVIALILLIGIGYAAITTTLTITGNSKISGDSSNFQNNVFFYSANLTSTGLRSEDSTAAQPKLNGNTMKFTVPATSALKVVGDKIEVNYTIRNESNYNAIIAVPTVESTATDFLDYFTVTHSRSGNLELGVNTTSDSQKLTLTLKKTYADTTAKQFSFTVKINATAEQATTNGANNNNGLVLMRYAHGMPDDNSPTDFHEVITQTGYNVFLQKNGNELSTCIYRNNNLFCITNNDYQTSKSKLMQEFGSENCYTDDDPDSDSSSANCDDDSFYCSAYSDGDVYCRDLAEDRICYVSSDGYAECHEPYPM